MYAKRLGVGHTDCKYSDGSSKTMLFGSNAVGKGFLRLFSSALASSPQVSQCFTLKTSSESTQYVKAHAAFQ